MGWTVWLLADLWGDVTPLESLNPCSCCLHGGSGGGGGGSRFDSIGRLTHGPILMYTRTGGGKQREGHFESTIDIFSTHPTVGYRLRRRGQHPATATDRAKHGIAIVQQRDAARGDQDFGGWGQPL